MNLSLYHRLFFLVLVVALVLPVHATDADAPSSGVVDSLVEWVIDAVDSFLELASSDEPPDSSSVGETNTPPHTDEFGPVYIPGG